MSARAPKTEGHQFLEHTTDAYIEAWGPNLERAFAEAAKGLYETMLDFENVDPILEGNIHVDGHDKKELLYNWLEQLLLEFDVKQMVYASYDLSIISVSRSAHELQAQLRGERYNRQKHGAKTEVKAVTYHLMEIEDVREARVRFILDL